MRSKLRVVVAGLVTGALAVGGALAGTILAPFGNEAPLPSAEKVLGAAGFTLTHHAFSGDTELTPEEIPAVAADLTIKAPKGSRLDEGFFLVGAARASLFPAPEQFGGEAGQWQTQGCTAIEDGHIDRDHAIPDIDPTDPVGSVAEIRGWPAASPDCVYLGGFGIGPVRPAERVDPGGVWVRAIAISNGEQTFIYEIADLVGWFSRYDTFVCRSNECGILDVRERVASDLGIGIADVAAGATHSHASADGYGGWGGIPVWYRQQIFEAAVAAAKQAVANLAPAVIAAGEVHLRNRNNERRDTYYSNVDTGASWVQAKALPIAKANPNAAKKVIATWATYAAHPTIVTENLLHADWPGAAARRFEAAYGGVGLLFEGGLGNASVSGVGGATRPERAENTGIAVADDIGRDIERGGTRLLSNEMKASVKTITHPVMTNPGLVTLGTIGLFDREFVAGSKGAGLPGFYRWSKRGELSSAGEDNDAPTHPEYLQGCETAGPTVITHAGAHRLGELTVAFAPGEIFSNIAEVIKEKADRSAVTMVLGQTNDSLGYIMQSFEFDTEGGGAVGEYATQHGEYEEVFAIDRCFGDHVLESILEATSDIGTGR